MHRLVLLALAATPAAQAEFDDGDWFGAREIHDGLAVVGYVVTVAEGVSLNGYTAGADHWTWFDGPAWRPSVRLVEIDELPDPAAYTWEVVEHAPFDTAVTAPWPEPTIGLGDRLYQVMVQDQGPPSHAGWMWRLGGQDPTICWLALPGGSKFLGGAGEDVLLVPGQAPSAEDVFHPLEGASVECGG